MLVRINWHYNQNAIINDQKLDEIREEQIEVASSQHLMAWQVSFVVIQCKAMSFLTKYVKLMVLRSMLGHNFGNSCWYLLGLRPGDDSNVLLAGFLVL